MGEILVRPGVTLLQDGRFFPLGQDSVLLADFAARKARGYGLDLGAGQGFLTVLTSLRTANCRIDGIELQTEAADIAAENCRRAGVKGNVTAGDLRSLPKTFYGVYDFVLCNPPYFEGKRGERAKTQALAQARSDCGADIGQVCRAAFLALKTGGKLFLCFPAERAEALFAALREHQLAPKRLRAVHNRADSSAGILLLEAVRQGGEGLEVLPPLILRDENGNYSREYREIYEG